MRRPHGPQLRVLLVDDDEDDALITRRMLAKATDRYQVDWSQSSTDALKMLGDEHDVLLLDYRLAGDTGLDLLQLTRARGNVTPAVLLTGQADDSLDELALRAGVVDYLDKNALSAGELDRALRYAAERGRNERERTDALMRERRAKMEAQSAHRRTASILDSITEAFCAIDDQWTITFANSATAAMRKMPLDEIIGRNFWEMFPESLGSEREARYRRAMRDRTPDHIDAYHASTGMWLSIKVFPWADGIALYVQDNSAQKLAEAGQAQLAATLDAERILFREVLHQLPVGVVVADVPSGRLRLGNAELERMWGQPFLASQVASGSQAWKGYRGDGTALKASEWPLARTLQSGEPVVGDVVQIVRRDDSRGVVRINSAMVRDEMGTDIAAVVTLEDVTAASRIEEALRESESFFRAAFVSSPVGSLLSSPTGQITRANPAFCALIGYTEAELRGRQVLELTHADDFGDILSARERILCDESAAEQQEIRLMHRDGLVVHCLASLALIRRPDGKPLYFTTQVIDTSDRKRAEQAELVLLEERTTALRAMRQREQYFRALTEKAADPVIIIDAIGTITYASPAVKGMLGLCSEEMLGMSTHAMTHPDDLPAFEGVLKRLLRHPSQSVVMDVRARHRDGSWKTVTNTATNLLADPAVNGIIINLRDVTQEKAMAHQLRQAQKLEAVGQLAGGVAHDFNNILTVIKLHGEFLLAAFDALDPRREDVAEISKAADRAVGLTRQLLAFSRQQILQPREMDINGAIAGIVPMLARLLGEDVEIHTLAGKGSMYVLADPGQIEQVLMNLAINARDAMENGGTLSIETQLVDLDDAYAASHETVPGRYVMIAVGDTGAGMPPSVRDRIFEPFFTTKEAGKGTGLGLATVYGIVKQSSGYITVYSELGYGSSFKIYLPLIAADAGPEVVRDLVPIPTGSETVLLAEDEESVRVLSRRILSRQGYKVLEARNGAEALELAAAFNGAIDLVVTDVVMPAMNGRQLVERLQVLRPDVKVLYASGYTRDEIVRRRALEPGPGMFLQKPFTSATLATAVREALDAPAAVAPLNQ